MMNLKNNALVLLLGLLLFFIYPVSADIENIISDDGNAAAIKYYNQAVDEASDGNMQAALRLIDRSLSYQPNFTLALVTKGNLLINQGDLIEAERILTLASENEPHDPMVLVSFASLMLSKGDANSTIMYADKALSLDSNIIEAYILKGTAYGMLTQYEDEVNISRQALILEPDNIPAQSNLDYALEHMKEVVEKKGDSNPSGQQSPLFGGVLLGGILIAVFIFRKGC